MSKRRIVEFKKSDLTTILDGVKGKTLGQVDTAHVFEKDKPHKGMAGAVIERSVLGYDPNSDKNPDIVVDGIPTEVKTTGVRQEGGAYRAKEYLAITNVSIDEIIHEEFLDSHFWKKLTNYLFVFYHYDSPTRVDYREYARFEILGWALGAFTEDQRVELEREWTMVRDYLREAHDSPDPEAAYSKMGSSLRENLRYIDTGPRYPNTPRFRLKKPFLNAVIDQTLNNTVQQQLPFAFNKYSDLDAYCHGISLRYKGMTVEQLINVFGIVVKDVNKLNKSISEQIMVRMFGGEKTKMSSIPKLAENSVVGKSIVRTVDGRNTEDTKFFTVDFDEMLDADIDFESSEMFEYFTNRVFLFMVLQEANRGQNFKENIFLGFKRMWFEEDFIYSEVKKCWSDLRKTAFSGCLRTEIVRDKNGEEIINKNGQPRRRTNFPKKLDHCVFMRGTGGDSNDVIEIMPGVETYPNTQIWVDGLVMVRKLDKLEFLR